MHLKTVEVHFNATFGEYLILIYKYFRKFCRLFLVLKDLNSCYKTFRLGGVITAS